MSFNKKDYNRKYYQKNKDKFRQYYKNWWNKKTEEEKKEWRHNYYLKNKEMFNKSSKKYIARNRAHVTFLCDRRRKEVAEILKEKGQRFTYLPKTERENKMSGRLSRLMNISLEEARQLLIDNDWNIKKLEFEYELEKLKEKYKEVL